MDDGTFIGSLNIHGFSVFKVQFDLKQAQDSLNSMLQDHRLQWQNIQSPPPTLQLKKGIDERNKRFQLICPKSTAWNEVFSQIETCLNNIFSNNDENNWTLEGRKVLLNDQLYAPSEQYFCTDYPFPSQHMEQSRVQKFECKDWCNLNNPFKFKDYFGKRTYLDTATPAHDSIIDDINKKLIYLRNRLLNMASYHCSKHYNQKKIDRVKHLRH
jgi:hypothetical protein